MCEKHGIDTDLIDDSLTFEENKRILEGLTIKSAEELINWARTLEDMEKHIDLADTYGIPYGFESEAPLILVRLYVKISRNRLRVADTRLRPFKKHIKEISRGYLMVEGQPREVATIIMKIEDLKPKILRFCKRYDSNFQYLPSVGWIRKNA